MILEYDVFCNRTAPRTAGNVGFQEILSLWKTIMRVGPGPLGQIEDDLALGSGTVARK